MDVAEMKKITGLSAAIVPHRMWAVSRWFYANPIWYYHRLSAAHEICAGGKFYQLVDEELRELCRLLNEAGVRTTPSCQGHTYPKERFERIWEELKREEGPIRREGLVVKDCENDRPYVFREEGYRVPWESFEEFYREAGAHQNVGYLGVVLPPGLEGLERRMSEDGYETAGLRVTRDDELGRMLGGVLMNVQVEAPDPPTRTREWAEFTGYVRDLLEANPHLRDVPIAQCKASGAGVEQAARMG